MAPYKPASWSWSKRCGGPALGLDVSASGILRPGDIFRALETYQVPDNKKGEADDDTTLFDGLVGLRSLRARDDADSGPTRTALARDGRPKANAQEVYVGHDQSSHTLF